MFGKLNIVGKTPLALLLFASAFAFACKGGSGSPVDVVFMAQGSVSSSYDEVYRIQASPGAHVSLDDMMKAFSKLPTSVMVSGAVSADSKEYFSEPSTKYVPDFGKVWFKEDLNDPGHPLTEVFRLDEDVVGNCETRLFAKYIVEGKYISLGARTACQSETGEKMKWVDVVEREYSKIGSDGKAEGGVDCGEAFKSKINACGGLEDDIYLWADGSNGSSYNRYKLKRGPDSNPIWYEESDGAPTATEFSFTFRDDVTGNINCLTCHEKDGTDVYYKVSVKAWDMDGDRWRVAATRYVKSGEPFGVDDEIRTELVHEGYDLDGIGSLADGKTEEKDLNDIRYAVPDKLVKFADGAAVSRNMVLYPIYKSAT